MSSSLLLEVFLDPLYNSAFSLPTTEYLPHYFGHTVLQVLLLLILKWVKHY